MSREVDTTTPKWCSIAYDDERDGRKIECPVCNMEYTHIRSVYSRIGGDEGKTPYPGTYGVTEEVCGRRTGLVVLAQCENGHWFRFILQEQKGINYTEYEIPGPAWRENPDGSITFLDEKLIWPAVFEEEF